MYHIGIIRSASSPVSRKKYNVQEIGLASELSELGMKVDVFLITDEKGSYNETINDRVIIHWIRGFKIPGQQGVYPELNRILDSSHYDLIQALDDSQITTVLVSLYCRKKGIRFVLWQGMYENYHEMYKRIIQFFYDRTFLKVLKANTKFCIAKTTSAKKYIIDKGIQNTIVIPVGLSIGNFNEKKRIDYREKLGISTEKKILLYIGKVEKRRMPIFCLNVFERLKKLHDDVSLVFVGNGPLLNDAKEYSAKEKLTDIYFINQIRQDELPSLYKEADFFILPTRYEIFGMVLMESMFFGTPVITYKAAGPLDLIIDDQDGLLLNDFEIDNWVERLAYHIFVKRDSHIMGKNASTKIQKEYLWKTISKKYYCAYMDILNPTDSVSQQRTEHIEEAE